MSIRRRADPAAAVFFRTPEVSNFRYVPVCKSAGRQIPVDIDIACGSALIFGCQAGRSPFF